LNEIRQEKQGSRSQALSTGAIESLGSR